MIRHFISAQCVRTSEGDLPEYLFTADDTGVSGSEGFINPPGLHPLPHPMDSFIAGLRDDEDVGLCQVSCDTHDKHLRQWAMAIETAKTPPAKIAKLGEVWEYTGGPGTFPSGLFFVASRSALVPYALLYMDTGTLLLLSVGAQVDGGIQLEHPNDWTCHGLLADLIKGKV